MAKDNVIDLKKPEPFIDDPITDILRSGTLLARRSGARGGPVEALSGMDRRLADRGHQ